LNMKVSGINFDQRIFSCIHIRNILHPEYVCSRCPSACIPCLDPCLHLVVVAFTTITSEVLAVLPRNEAFWWVLWRRINTTEGWAIRVYFGMLSDSMPILLMVLFFAVFILLSKQVQWDTRKETIVMMPRYDC
jgi:hypothetical protein